MSREVAQTYHLVELYNCCATCADCATGFKLQINFMLAEMAEKAPDQCKSTVEDALFLFHFLLPIKLSYSCKPMIFYLHIDHFVDILCSLTPIHNP